MSNAVKEALKEAIEEASKGASKPDETVREWPVIITLTTPVEVNGQKVDKLTFRSPRGERSLRLTMSGQPAIVAEAELQVSDVRDGVTWRLGDQDGHSSAGQPVRLPDGSGSGGKGLSTPPPAGGGRPGAAGGSPSGGELPARNHPPGDGTPLRQIKGHFVLSINDVPEI